MTFPRAQDRDHPDSGDWFSGSGVEEVGWRNAWVEPIDVDAGGDGVDPVGGNAEDGFQFAGDLVARGEDVVGEGREGVPADEGVAVVDIDVPRSNDEGSSGEAAGKTDDVAIARAVSVEDIDLVLSEPHGDVSGRERVESLSSVEVEDGNAFFFGASIDLAVAGSDEGDGATAGPKTEKLSHDTHFLSAPAEGGFGMGDVPL